MVRGANAHRPPVAPLSGTSGTSVAPIAAVENTAITADAVLTRVGLTAAASLEEAGGLDLAEGMRCGRALSVAMAALERTSSAWLECMPGLRVPARFCSC
ncbi:hypothetical protein NDU88_005042 [Pleurodeles waltl]|uniref:Uncharacterized protein n=1 Tax=Pleurodeles waltl TaxID=8319 RepID=A0AAV7NQC0_PLEWA|nr:hypothetical protein NDU88_005042 [Pleurodeles waltl]